MAVDVSKIPNNSKFDPVREAILKLQKDVQEGVAGVATVNSSDGNITITKSGNITVDTVGETITIGINDSDYLSLSDAGTQTIAGNIIINGDLEVVGDITGSIEEARTVRIVVKNTETTTLAKGTVVHVHPSANPPSGNVVEVKKADYDTASLMPAIGILNESLAAGAEGRATMFGFISGINTSSFSAGDELYVGNDGALTNTKPTGATQLIQKIAVVVKSHASNGSIEVFGAGRSNDVPNLNVTNASISGNILTLNRANATNVVYNPSFLPLTGGTIGGDLIINGDLTVSGNTVTKLSEEVLIEDAVIVLNSNEDGTPTENAGIEIERGTSANKKFLWDETSDKWTLGSETLVAGTFEGNLTGNADTATNADKLDGYHASAFALAGHNHDDRYYTETESDARFTKYVNLTNQVQLSSYSKSVIALCNADNSDVGRNSYSIGTLTFHRNNGLSAPVKLDIAIEKRYNANGTNVVALAIGGDSFADNIQYVTFEYNNVIYGGIEFYFAAAQHHEVTFYGRSNFDIFGLDYYDDNASPQILNQEVYDSISTTNVSLETDFFFNNNKVWHEGNDGSGSGLDADKVDGKHATDFTLDYVTDNGNSTTNSIIVGGITANNVSATSGDFEDLFLTNASGSSLIFRNSQGNTADADNLATMSFQGYYGTGFVGASRIQVKANEDFSSTARGTVINFDFWDTGSTYNTVASIDSDGFYIGTTNVYDNLPDGITYSTTDNRLKIGVSKNVGSTTETAIQPILLANLLTEGYVPYVATGGAGTATVNSKVSDSWLKLTTNTLELGASDPISHEIKYARFLWQSGQNDKISTVYGARDITASIQYLGGSKTAKIEFTTGSGGGRIQFNDEYTFPAADGTSGQVLSTNGSGDLSWVNQSGGSGITDRLYLEGGDTNSAGTTFWWRQGNSGNAGSTWRKVCDVDIPTGLWAALSMDITYYYSGSNHGASASLLTKKYSASFRRSNGTQDGYNDAVLYGDDNLRVRIVKIGTGDYELQARAYNDNFGISVEYVVTGGNADWVTPATSIVAGNTTGTAYTASPNAATDLELAGDIVAKALYDADNTAYYIDPNGTSVVLSMTGLSSNFNNAAVTGTFRASGDLNYFGTATTNNEAEIVVDTGNAGSPQIGFTEHGDASWAIGVDDGDNSFKIHGTANATIPTINNLASPIFELTTSGDLITSGKTFTDGLVIDNVSWNTGKVRIEGASPNIEFRGTDAGDIYWQLGGNGNSFYVLHDTDKDGTFETLYPLQLDSNNSTGKLYGSRIFADNYHPNADNADTLDGEHGSFYTNASNISTGTLDGDRLEWYDNDGFNGTYPIVWTSTNGLYRSTWFQIRGSDDTILAKNLNLDGNINFTGDSRIIDLSGGTTASQNALIIGEQNLYGVRFKWDSGSQLLFEGFWNTSTTGAENRDLGSIDVNNRIWYLYDRVVTSRIDVAADIYVGDQIIHTGDTNTYTQFHAADQWRVVTGGSERLEVNNAATTVQNTLIANDYLGVGVAPISKFHVVHTTFPQVRINDDSGGGNAGIRFKTYNGSIGIHSDIYTQVGAVDEVGYMGFRVNYSKERFRLYSWGGGSFGVAGNGTNDQGRWLSFEGNTDGSGEGSGRLFFSEHNSTTTDMDKYGMSIGYRGGGTTITTAGGGSWTGLSQIGNGQWGMWGHNADVTGSLIMYGDRQATFVDFAANNIQGVANLTATNINIADGIYHVGDTNTYIQFHATDQWRVVTGGAERLEVNNTQTTIAQPLVVNGSYAVTQDKIRSIDGENYFNINDDTTVEELNEQFGSVTGGSISYVSKVDDNTAPAPGCFELNGAVYFDGGGDYIKVDPNSGYTWEMWVKYVSGTDTDSRIYLGWSMYDSSKNYYGNTQRYWGCSGTQFDANSNNSGWYKIQGTIAGIGTGTGQFISGAEYAKTVLLLNYGGGSNVIRVCGFKLYKSRKRATELQLFRKDSISVNTAANNDLIHSNKINLINNGSDVLRIETPTGYTDVGSANSSYSHFSTDRNAFYFNTHIYFDGNLYDYDGSTYYLKPSSTSNVNVVTANDIYLSNLHVASRIYHRDDTNTYINMVAADDMQLVCGGRQMIRMDEGTDPDRLRFTEDNSWTNSSGEWRFHSRVGINIDPSSAAPNNAKLLIQGSSYGDRCFHFIGNGYSSVGSVEMPANNSGISFVNNGASGQSALAFVYGTSNVGRIAINSTSTSYVTTSDYRLKENLVPITDGIDRLKLLQPKRFNFIGSENVVDGFVAHEAQEVVPEAVTGEKDGIDWEGNPDYQGIDQAKLVPLLTAALQEAVAKIESLEARVAQLENNV